MSNQGKNSQWQPIEKHEQIINALASKVAYMDNKPDYDLLVDYYWEAHYLLEDYPEKRDIVFKLTDFVKRWCDCLWRTENDEYYNLYYETLRFEAPYLFDSFCIYMEKKRPYEKRFYEPRRSVLKVVADDLQDLEDGKYMFYGLSMPPRVGKSTICIFFMAWVMGKRFDSNNAMCGHSGLLAKGFFEELLNLLESNEYTYIEIFPNCVRNGKIVQKKSADDLTINMGHSKRFQTFVARGIDGTWTGAVNISNDGYLYIDDLIRDRTHSLSPTRMEATFQEYLNKCVDRMNEGSKQLMVGTLWSVIDPLSRIQEKYCNDSRYKFRKIPALDENDESNFAYKVNGFSSEYYRDMRERLDPPEWFAKFQQAPYVREGILFEIDNLSYFDGLISKQENGELYAVCDVAFGGGDSVSMPIGLKVGDDVYIIDWVFDNGGTNRTVPLVGDAIIRHGVKSITFEKNNGGELYSEKVKNYLISNNYVCAITCKPAPNRISKVDKIKAYSDDIIRHFKFIKSSTQEYDEEDIVDYDLYKRNNQYNRAMSETGMFVTVGKNEHDDAPDSLAMLAVEIFGYIDDRAKNSIAATFNPFRRY